jgi:hypothetical protein
MLSFEASLFAFAVLVIIVIVYFMNKKGYFKEGVREKRHHRHRYVDVQQATANRIDTTAVMAPGRFAQTDNVK